MSITQVLGLVLCSNYISPSIQAGEATTSSADDRRQSSTTPIDSFGNTPGPQWLAEALKDIAYYLRAHKFNEYDRRYEPDGDRARRGYYGGFPKPPLRSLHWEVRKYCEPSLLECANYLRMRIGEAELRRKDDTSVVIQEQQWDLFNNSAQITLLDEECRKMAQMDEVQARPFEGPIERFQWRTTASYYMCWYTMKSEPALAHLSERCDNFARCLDRGMGPHNDDPRADDGTPFACALYSFCPDPCCPKNKHLTGLEKCLNTLHNPCRDANPAGQRECRLNRSLNTDFRDLVLNRWNVSCSCPHKGYEWSSRYGMCVDVNECSATMDDGGGGGVAAHNCNVATQVCLNLPGNFTCACKWGLVYDGRRCLPSVAIQSLGARRQDNEQETGTRRPSLWGGIGKMMDGSGAPVLTADSVHFALFIISSSITCYCIK